MSVLYNIKGPKLIEYGVLCQYSYKDYPMLSLNYINILLPETKNNSVIISLSNCSNETLMREIKRLSSYYYVGVFHQERH